MGRPPDETAKEVVKIFDPLFPNKDAYTNRELVSLLTYLGSSSVVAKAIPLLRVSESAERLEKVSSELTSRNEVYGDVVQGSAASRPDRQQIALAYALRTAKVGWTPTLRNDYFAWFKTTHKWKGGLSFNGFIENIRTIALATVVDDAKEKAALAELSQRPPPAYLSNVVPPKGPGKDYTVDDAMNIVTGNLVGRNYEQGKSLFTGASCIMCHVYSGEGGSAGPDLTRASSRYSARDLLESIVQPSLVVSDIYAAEELSLKDGSKISGHIAFEEPGSLFVVANPYMPQDLTLIKESDVVGRKENPISQMPPGLLNALNEDEVRDLVAYILSSANPKDPMFAAEP
jgi:putative heme-binding domain-containing protein